MGHITTSAVESSHSSINKYLVTSRATHGLPCRHILYKHLTGDSPVELKQIHKHWWNYRPVANAEEHQVVYAVPNIPLAPVKVNEKGRPTGAIALAPASNKKGEGITASKGKGKSQGKGKSRGRPRKQQSQQLQPQARQQTQEADCIVVAVVATTTKLGLLRLQEAQEDTCCIWSDRDKPGTAMPRAYQRNIDALDVVDPEVEDTYDALLADGETQARVAREDAAALQEDDEGEEEGATVDN
ncbi:hypothetical protein C8A03DRAFT_48282 [Achaetomium macrosporum]|uniref:Uncharacterized protein n=1 Tax=Achaetomium macrosporum TaxID=79813 RepID=A0AAN7H971_9PEZI|nr:hypothetical protein C8A03DRAFT_48282 [Achaetomium macrosporum]